MFGIPKSDSKSIFGPYYYFTDYENARNIFSNNQQKTYGIVRFAVFLGNMNISMKPINEEMDIVDHEGKWTKKFDSVYLGKSKLYHKSVLPCTPLWVIKEFQQQYTLSVKIIRDVNI